MIRSPNLFSTSALSHLPVPYPNYECPANAYEINATTASRNTFSIFQGTKCFASNSERGALPLPTNCHQRVRANYRTQRWLRALYVQVVPDTAVQRQQLPSASQRFERFQTKADQVGWGPAASSIWVDPYCNWLVYRHHRRCSQKSPLFC